jgi:hypothetical protein
MALKVWDIHSNASREATQLDIDILEAKVNAFGRLLSTLRVIEAELGIQVTMIQQRHSTSLSLSGDL